MRVSDTDTCTHTQREREGSTHTHRHTHAHRERDTNTHTHIDTHTYTERERERFKVPMQHWTVPAISICHDTHPPVTLPLTIVWSISTDHGSYQGTYHHCRGGERPTRADRGCYEGEATSSPLLCTVISQELIFTELVEHYIILPVHVLACVVWCSVVWCGQYANLSLASRVEYLPAQLHHIPTSSYLTLPYLILP